MLKTLSILRSHLSHFIILRAKVCLGNIYSRNNFAGTFSVKNDAVSSLEDAAHLGEKCANYNLQDSSYLSVKGVCVRGTRQQAMSTGEVFFFLCADIAPGRCNYFNFLSSRQLRWRRFLLPSDSAMRCAHSRGVITVMPRTFNERIRKCMARLRSPRLEGISPRELQN